MAVNLGFQKPLKELLKTERVGIHIGRNRTCWKHLGRHRGDVRTNPTTHWLGPSGTTKKTSEAPTPQRSGVSSSMPPSPSSWCSAVRSRRTVRRGGDDRSWFGRPQAIKKAAGSAASKKGGTNTSKSLGSPAGPPSLGSEENRGCRLRTAKKKQRSHPLPKRRIAPSPKKHPKD